MNDNMHFVDRAYDQFALLIEEKRFTGHGRVSVSYVSPWTLHRQLGGKSAWMSREVKICKIPCNLNVYLDPTWLKNTSTRIF